jgi:hypothetical protein
MLATFGGSEYLTQEESQNAYVCSTTGDLGIFTGNPSHPKPLSRSGMTGYWVDYENEDANRQSRCSKGVWIPLNDYMEDHGQTLIDAVNEPEQIPVTPTYAESLQYSCDNKGCEKI